MIKITKRVDSIFKSIEFDFIYFLFILFPYRVNKDGFYLFLLLVFAFIICLLYRIDFYNKANLYKNEGDKLAIMLILFYSFSHLYFAVEAEKLYYTHSKFMGLGIYFITILKLFIIALKVFFNNIFVGLYMLLYIGLLVKNTSGFTDIILNILEGFFLYLFTKYLKYDNNNYEYNFKAFIKDNSFELLMLILILFSMLFEPFVTRCILIQKNIGYVCDSKIYYMLRFIVIYFMSIILLIIVKGVFDFLRR